MAKLQYSVLLASVCLLCSLPAVDALHHMKRAPLQYVNRRDDTRPLKVSNRCVETIYPGIATQAGNPPSTQGFGLATGSSRELTVSADWQGRVWGRTNCSFNAQGTGPSNVGGNNGGGSACATGDCNGIVDCKVTVRRPCQAQSHTGFTKSPIGEYACDVSRIYPRIV